MRGRLPVLILTLALLVLDVALRPVVALAPAGPRDWETEFRQVLQDNLLEFWLDHGLDRERGGMVGWLDREGNPIPPATKSLVQQAREVWAFSAAYRMYPHPAYKQAAAQARKFVREKMYDPANGGYYWLVSREGRVLENKKHLYGESFVIYAFAEYARAFDDAQARKEAMQLFDLFERKAHDDAYGGYHEAFTVDWRPSKADKTIAANGRKALNTHLHLLESLTTLYKATGDQRVRRRVEELLNLFATKIVDPRRGFARTFFNEDWSPADAVTSSYGHDIELSWLMTETAEELGGPVPDYQRRLSLALVDHTLRYGFDRANGGVFDEGPAGGSPTSMRMNWWVQAEALIGLLNAYQLSGQPKYWQAFEQQAKYTLDHFVDREYGEWYNTILPDGRITGPKASDWKGPYHAGRACMEVVRRLQRMREAPGG